MHHAFCLQFADGSRKSKREVPTKSKKLGSNCMILPREDQLTPNGSATGRGRWRYAPQQQAVQQQMRAHEREQ